jgi:S1-C subfamily serine protease
MKSRLLTPFIILIGFIFIVSTACMGGGGTTPTSAPSTPEGKIEIATEAVQENTEPAGNAGSGLVSSLDDVRKATIQIESDGTFVDPEYGLQVNSAGRGSGFIIDPSGIAVTNNHVVTGAALLKVWVGGESTARNAHILGVSECSDLAVIKIEGNNFPYLKWSADPIKVNMDVYVAGYPLGDPTFTSTRGQISKEQSEGESTWASVSSELEYDANTNPGNSGGPVVNDKGEVIAIHYAGNTSTRQSWGISRDLAEGVVDELKTGKDVDTIGINGQAVPLGQTESGETINGIWISSVKSGSTADKAGVLPGDILYQMEGLVLASDGTMKDYCSILRSHDLTDTLSLTIIRVSTGEIMEGQLNGRALATTGTFGSGSSSSGGTSSTTTAGSVNSINTEFETDYTQEGWYPAIIPNDNAEEVSITQKPGRLSVVISKENTNAYLFNDTLSAADVSLSTTATKISGPNRFTVSLVCRATEKGWYEFSISAGGYWVIYKVDASANNPYQTLSKGASKYIHVQGGTNVLTADCIGNNLTFYANDGKLGEATDRDFTSGSVGINVSSLDLKGVDVEIENFAGDAVQ